MIEARRTKNLTQDGLADAVKTTRGHIAHIENGTRDPSVSLAKSLAKELGLQWTIFFDHLCVKSKQSLKRASVKSEKQKRKIRRRPYTQLEREYICKFVERDGVESIADALDRTPKAISEQVALLKSEGTYEEYKRRYEAREMKELSS